MIKLIQTGSLHPSTAYGLKLFSALTLGIGLGCFYGWWKAIDINHLASTKYLTPYQSEDQINELIEQKQLPAIIYYYAPGIHSHVVLRQHMLKYSTLYPDKAIWVMVNLTKNLEQARQALKTISYSYATLRVEARFPKSDIAIFQKMPQGKLQLIAQKYGNRREVYDYAIYSREFQTFLQDMGIIKGEDPMLPMLQVTKKSLFGDL